MSRRSIRLRLALSYASVFFVFGAALLGVSYVVVRHELGPQAIKVTSPLGEGPPARFVLRDAPAPAGPEDERMRIQVLIDSFEARTATGVRNVLLAFAGALLLSTIASLAMGWWLAGRALAPVSRITEAARRVSEENLHERIGLQGPDDELKELADTFDGMLGKLDRAFDGQQRFIAHASHELRTPLAVMRTALDVNGEDGGYRDPETVADMVATLRRSVARSEALVDRLLALATGAAHARRCDGVRITAMTADILAEAEAMAADAGVTITATGLDQDLVVSGDEVLLRHLIRNLVDNAIVHNHPGGRIQISWSRGAAQTCRLRIVNDGRPFTGDVRDLLQPFRRGVADGRPGFGLGLSIVDAVVRAHDGVLSLRPSDPGGLEVEVLLPAPAQAPAPALHV